MLISPYIIDSKINLQRYGKNNEFTIHLKLISLGCHCDEIKIIGISRNVQGRVKPKRFKFWFEHTQSDHNATIDYIFYSAKY